MKISFLILTWNRYKFLEQCLSNLLASIDDLSDCEIVIMDNGSTDATHDVLEKYKNHKSFRIIKLKKNYGISSYKKLFREVKGKYAVIVDDDVLSFPQGLDKIFADYMTTYTDYGFVALNVIQNELTNGAKPGPEHYTDDVRGDKVIERGPTGGWCTCYRKSDYNKIKWRLYFAKMDMKMSEDGVLSSLLSIRLKLKAGLIKNAVCLHACGPYYAKEYGHLKREFEKYTASGLPEFAERFKE
ncbi:MAG: glycosyltransferase family 2 protein [Mucilaginibacter sp.]|uniref:glycosyltransferase family 2 protein n=1 Tax=Mucilaginibacter sp. TaxID=1882438 RepID=UPI0032668766